MAEWDAHRLRAQLKYMFPEESHALFWEVRNKTGYMTGGRERYADAIAMSLWPSRGLDIIGFEIKVSRTDWQKELKDPSKSEALMQFCDKWYLVVGDKSIVHDGELPPTWGLIAPKRTRLGIITPAPTLTPKPVSKPFLASILRASQRLQNESMQDMVAAQVKAKLELRAKQRKDYEEHWKKQYDKLREKVEEFEENAGFRITGWGAANPGLLGKLVNYVQGRGARVIIQQARNMQVKIDELAKAAEEVIKVAEENDVEIPPPGVVP